VPVSVAVVAVRLGVAVVAVGDRRGWLMKVACLQVRVEGLGEDTEIRTEWTGVGGLWFVSGAASMVAGAVVAPSWGSCPEVWMWVVALVTMVAVTVVPALWLEAVVVGAAVAVGAR